MRARRTKGTLLNRLERLEASAESQPQLKIRMGNLRRLPQDYKGPRHVVIAKHLPSQSGQEWVEFEERPGPDPKPPPDRRRGLPEYLDVRFVADYPAQP
jgi:hypothetical protein